MKHIKHILFSCIAIISLSAGSISAQNVKVFLKDGTVKEFLSADVDSVVFDADNSFHPQAVDLGLSVKWATCNIGAETPGGIGKYYAWGETEEKERYSSSTYFDPTYQYTAITNDTCFCGNPEYDAATAEWGEEWRMPTTEEFNELIEKCRWKSIRQNGTNGYRVTGPNGNTIFLPATGYKSDASTSSLQESGCYWTACNTREYDEPAYECYFSLSSKDVSLNYRYLGFNIRAVLNDKTK